MTRKLTCIECPKGCALTAKLRRGKVTGVTGCGCRKGRKYATQEIERPVRILTSTVRADGLRLKMVPVRTDRAIPKNDLKKAMDAIHSARIKGPCRIGDVIISGISGTKANLIVTRDCD